jgi:creatinine amidohydrolase
MTTLGERTWVEVHDAATAGAPLLVVPLGSCEQHGPHLPLDTDTRIALALAGRLAADRPPAVVAPPVAYGASGEHAGFAGTLSIGQDALEHLLVELVRSADGFAGTVVVNGHGGNAATLERAGAVLRAEGRRVLTWHPALNGDAHAGRTETSLLLALDPAAVRLDRAEAGNRQPLAVLMPALRTRGLAAVSPNGVLGDPTGATATEGYELLDRLAADLVTAVDEWRASW